MVIGPVADDNVYLTVKLFETGVLEKEEAIKRLKIEKLFEQILFHTEKALVYCMFSHYEDLEARTMDKDKFYAVFPIICAAVVDKIAVELKLSDNDAVTELYSSHLYEMLEQEDTKFWQYSTEKLFEMFLEERNSGKISIPQV